MSQEIPFHDETTSRFFGRSTRMSTQHWADLESLHPGQPKAQLQAWIDQATEDIRTGGREADEDTSAYRKAMAGLCRRAGLSPADSTADLLILMSEGAKAARQFEESESLSDRFRRAAEATIARLSRRNG